MDAYPPLRSPPGHASPPNRQDPRWPGREDDNYRRRSPGPYDRRSRPRNRSRSPVMIDRYQPEPYGSSLRDRDDRRRAASPTPANIDRYVPGQDPKPIAINPIADPHKADIQVGFSYFADWWRFNEQIKEENERQRTGARRPPDRVKGERESREDRAKERAQIQVAYDSYKEDLQIRMAKRFVQERKNDEWFKERYVAAIRDPFRERLFQLRRQYYTNWERDMDMGVFDEFTLEGIYKGDANGSGGMAEKEEGETITTTEVLGVGDLVPYKGGEIRDETVFQPALLIKTIAPTVSREKIEEFCKEHLGEADGGFQWLSLSDPNPSKRYHRIGWVMLHPAPPSDVPMIRGDGRGGDDEPAEKPKSTAEVALEAINDKTIKDETRGDFTCHVGVHAPPAELRKKALWDLFSAPERVERDLEMATRLVQKLDSESQIGFDAFTKITEKVEELRQNGVLKPVQATTAAQAKTKKTPASLSMDTDDPDAGELDVEMSEDEGAYDEEVDDEEITVTKKKLDLIVEYLRRVHHFCFFCVFETDSVHELGRKCPGGHLRRPRATLNSAAKAAAKASVAGLPFPQKRDNKEEGENDASPVGKGARPVSKTEQQLQRAFSWVKTFEDKLFQILEPENVDIRKIGGKPVEEALDEELLKWVKQEDESKYRCKVPECTKLFKGKDFWKKHVEKRHPEWLERLRQDVDLVNKYVLDPSHIAPSRSDANSNGHFPNSQFTNGTPRGFSFNGMPMNFGSAMMGNGMFPSPVGFPPSFGSHPVHLPNSWGAPGPDFGGDDRHQPGPMRRGGGNFRNNNRLNPYDRRPRDSRDARYNGGPGGRSPPRGGPRPGGASKWGDGAGSAAVGPREAVQGRNLKSYEDLDAVGGGGAGELNY